MKSLPAPVPLPLYHLSLKTSQDKYRTWQPSDLATFMLIEPYVLQFQGFAANLEAAERWLNTGEVIDLLEISPITGSRTPSHTQDRYWRGAPAIDDHTATWQDKAEWLRLNSYELKIGAMGSNSDDSDKWVASIEGWQRQCYAPTIGEAVEQIYGWIIQKPFPEVLTRITKCQK